MRKVAGVQIPEKFQPWLKLIGKIAFLLFAIFIIFFILFGVGRNVGVAMDPNLKDGELVLFSRAWNSYTNGDVVLYEHDGKMEFSRILALPDQIVDLNSDGYLTVNGVIESSRAIVDITDDEAFTKAKLLFPYRVPTKQYYLLNDNYDCDDDSRKFGAVEEKDLKGKAMSTLKVRNI
ncbi:signal peptidase I [Candidatus Saccharibacteria bacterium]|nr:signal peptidase I [Candidatus Saccharibacteria bacterium]